ncbi:MAG: hypothetical protein OXG44_15075 [Gammaproteobacteria bacterium]|nr:hypothetical protein [Gammaproteobacteria bacterium]
MTQPTGGRTDEWRYLMPTSEAYKALSERLDAVIGRITDRSCEMLARQEEHHHLTEQAFLPQMLTSNGQTVLERLHDDVKLLPEAAGE